MPDSVEVRPVETRSDRRQFLDLPWSLYRGDPNWVPPLRISQKGLIGFASHPFYKDASAQTFLARRNGAVCGRVSAIVNPNHNRRHEDKIGFCGFFECTDDQEAASALLDAASEWLVERGMDTMRGPVNPSMNYECGLLVDGFDSMPTFMMPYNPPYYERLLTAYGLEKSQDLFTYKGDIDFLNSLDPRLYDLMHQAMDRFQVTTRMIDVKNYRQEVDLILGMFNRATVGSWGFVPLTDAEAEHLGKELGFLLEPKLVRIAEVEGKPVGVLMGVLDFNPIIKEINGRVLPFGFLKLKYGRKRLKHVRFMSANVVPEFQRWGLGMILLGANKDDGLAMGLQTAELSWIMESNPLSRMGLEKAGMTPTKTHRIFDRAIG